MPQQQLQLNPQGVKFWLAVSVLALLAALVFGVFLPQARQRRQAGVAKQMLHALQLGVERFAVDTEGSYPYDLGDIFRKDYLPGVPLNPYTGAPLHWVSLDAPPADESGWHPTPPLPAMGRGDVAYLRIFATPQMAGLPAAQREIDGYRLVLYE